MEDNKLIFTPFNDTGSNIIMPGQYKVNDENIEKNINDTGVNVKDAKITDAELKEKISGQDILISEGVEDALKGDTVKSMILKENEDIEIPNFTLDMSNVQSVGQLQMEALDALLHTDGNTALYVLNTKTGMVKLGMGLNGMLNKILPRVVYNVFGEECKIYGDFEIGKKAKLITDTNITTKRMNI